MSSDEVTVTTTATAMAISVTVTNLSDLLLHSEAIVTGEIEYERVDLSSEFIVGLDQSLKLYAKRALNIITRYMLEAQLAGKSLDMFFPFVFKYGCTPELGCYPNDPPLLKITVKFPEVLRGNILYPEDIVARVKCFRSKTDKAEWNVQIHGEAGFIYGLITIGMLLKNMLMEHFDHSGLKAELKRGFPLRLNPRPVCKSCHCYNPQWEDT